MSGSSSRPTGRAVWSVAALAVVALVSCKGGGDGTEPGFGNELPPASGPGDVESFFPTAPGNTWSYLATEGNPPLHSPGAYLDAVTVTGARTVMGVPATAFLESNPGASGTPVEGYFLKNAGGLAFLGTNDLTDELTAGLVPYVLARFPVAPGVVAQYGKQWTLATDFDDDARADAVIVHVKNSVALEPLTIAAGSFPRTLKATEEQSGAIVLSASGARVGFSSTLTRWLAPGIGVLKVQQRATVDSESTSDSMEARGWTVDGVSHGLALPHPLATGLATGDPTYVSQRPPALATDGTHFLAVAGSQEGVTVKLLDATGAELSSHLLPGVGAPLAGFDGTSYWVVYENASSPGSSGPGPTPLARRLSAAGEWVDASDLTLVAPGPDVTSVGLAFGGATGLLAYSEFDDPTYQHLLYGVVVHADGTASAPFPIAVDDSTHSSPAAAFDGASFLVVWRQAVGSGSADGDIYGVRVSPTGAVLDPQPIAISTAPDDQGTPGVAFDGSNYLVVWLDLRNRNGGAGAYPEVYGARVSPDGQLLDGPASSGGFPIASGGTEVVRQSPSVALLGTDYLVAWACLGYASTGAPGIQAARVGTDGTPRGGAASAIGVSGPPAGSAQAPTFTALAAGPQHGAIVWLDFTEAGSMRLVGASVSPF